LAFSAIDGGQRSGLTLEDGAMRLWCMLLGLAVFWTTCAETARAGVYSTIEPDWTLSDLHFRKFQEKSLTPLKQLGTAEAMDSWQKYYHLAATGLLVAKEPPGRGEPDILTVEERLNLGTCLLRVRLLTKEVPAKDQKLVIIPLAEKAIRILDAASKHERDNFLVMSTLGTAYQMTGDYQRAGDWLSEAWRYWGQPFNKLSAERRKFLVETMKWTEEKFAWYSKCEKYQRHLVRLRLRELKQGLPTFAQAMERLDPLFDPDPAPAGYQPLRFVGESGQFEPGKIAAAEMAKLPPDAILVVEQLLVWMPDDLRLYRLLGELLNAKGDVASARIVFEEFLGKFSQIGLGKVADPNDLFPHFLEKYPEVGGRLKALKEYVPPLPKDQAHAQEGTKPPGDSTPPPPAVGEIKLDWQALAVGLGAGALAGFLLAWRLRQILQRRAGRQPVSWNPTGAGSTAIRADKH
jgi:tetratricopeptide (TPR) repeat protein